MKLPLTSVGLMNKSIISALKDLTQKPFDEAKKSDKAALGKNDILKRVLAIQFNHLSNST